MRLLRIGADREGGPGLHFDRAPKNVARRSPRGRAEDPTLGLIAERARTYVASVRGPPWWGLVSRRVFCTAARGRRGSRGYRVLVMWTTARHPAGRPLDPLT